MSIWRSFFGKKKVEEQFHGKLAWLGCDMHNHILPGLDDGCEHVSDSLILIAGLKELGIHRCISTPHVMHGVYNNTPTCLKIAHQKTIDALTDQKIDFELEYSAEYMIDDQLEHIINNDSLCALPNRHVLIEMSYLAESKALFQTIKELQNKGYQPVLAHPERYNYFHQNFKVYREIKDAGCLFQLNLLAISRYYGEQVKSAALTLIKSGMYDLVGTDMHHVKHLSAIKEVVGKYDVQELLIDNPIKNAIIFEKAERVAL